METELWPNLLRQCHKQSVPVALVNGRISQKSFGRYQKIRAFMKRVLDDLQIALMQSEEDANRIRKLGMAPERLLVSGNLKFDSSTTAETDAALTSSIRGRFSFGNTRLIVAASTHAPEENILIEAFKRVRESDLGIGVRLLIAPRHPERFDEVTRLIQASGLSYARRSFAPSDADVACDIVLLDSIGELRAVLPLADIAFVGGSIAPHGGHNMLEPAAYGVCVVTGPHTHNFAAVAQALLAEDALVQLPEVELADAPAELASTLDKLLRDDSQREQIGRRALAVCERNRGATEYTIRVVADLLKSSEALNESIPFPAVQATAAK
jgi:3-deoxy-D-manno-octulosonic-acid transferase